MTYLAHIKEDGKGGVIEQTVKEHCVNVANYTSNCLDGVGLNNTGYLIGLLHDAGKCKEEFQQYIINNVGVRGSVNHTFAGTRMILDLFHNQIENNDVNSEMIAYAIGAHHGFFDCVDCKGRSGFEHRVKKSDIFFEESRDNFLSSVCGSQEINKYFELSSCELNSIYDKIQILFDNNNSNKNYPDESELNFYLSLLQRLLTSSVIEGDRRDTAEFYNDDIKIKRKNINIEWDKYLSNVEDKISNFNSNGNEINKARALFSDKCKEFSFNKTGVYRLNLPTGAGKTLSSLRFALSHLLENNKKRILFINPLLSILEQNALVIKEFLGDPTIVLEHHSDSLDINNEHNELNMKELAVENWDYPVIITTLVQLLNTIFSGKTSSIRRFNALVDSIVIIDEVQTVPNNMLGIFNLAINFLSNICNTTFVLCSATQPCLENTKHSLLYTNPIDIVPYKKEIWEIFERTSLKDEGRLTMDEIIKLSKEVYQNSDNLLIVCNKRSEANLIFREISLEFDNCYHLSASMCTKHRRDVLKKVKNELKNGVKVVCVSTQVIEAGVDISFDRVIRFVAGMDSIVQSAGRCNRNKEKKLGFVHIVNCCDENLMNLREIQYGKDTTTKLLYRFSNDKKSFDNDLMSDKSIKWYYRELFYSQNEIKGYHDYYIKKYETSIYEMLSENLRFTSSTDSDYYLQSALKTAGEEFTVFDKETHNVVVDYDGESERLIKDLIEEENVDILYLQKWLKKIKPYLISMYDYQLDKLSDVIYQVEGIKILNKDYYDKQMGVVFDKNTCFLEI